MRTSVHETDTPAAGRPGAPKAPSRAAPATAFLVQRTRRDSLISFEVFPPRPTAAAEKVWDRIENMAQAKPDYFSVTHGHQQLPNANREVIQHLLHATRLPVMAHLICSGSTAEQMRSTVEELLAGGVRDILALRGDPPNGNEDWIHQPQGLNRATELVRLIRSIEEQRFSPPGGPGARPVSISVAAYAPSGAGRDYAADLHSLWEKQQAGADYAITQVLYDAEDYAQLVDDARAQGIHLPIVAGIAPLTSPDRLHRLEQISGVPVPSKLLEYLQIPNSEERRRRGLAATLRLIDNLLELGCPGLHLFTFNNDSAALAILEHLRVRDAARHHRIG